MKLYGLFNNGLLNDGIFVDEHKDSQELELVSTVIHDLIVINHYLVIFYIFFKI